MAATEFLVVPEHTINTQEQAAGMHRGSAELPLVPSEGQEALLARIATVSRAGPTGRATAPVTAATDFALAPVWLAHVRIQFAALLSAATNAAERARLIPLAFLAGSVGSLRPACHQPE